MITILQGDCVERMRTMAPETVQLVVTSPPYDDLRTYGGHKWNFEQTARELVRLLCPGGLVCWNVGDSVVDGSETLTSAKQKIFFREECGFRIHDTMIYEKPNFSAASATRYHQCFEYVFILSKGTPRVFNAIIDKPNANAGKTTFGRNGKRQPDGTMRERRRCVYAEFGKRSNVWRGNTAGQENPCKALPHPAMMPKWLARDLIISWSNAGDMVLDPMAGGGTTGLEAIKLGRQAILIDSNPEYVELMKTGVAGCTPGLALA